MIVNVKKIGFIIILLTFTILSNGQSETDSTNLSIADTSAIDKTKREWSKAEKVGLMSAAVPGLGQFYNKKYWKTPIIWLAEGALLTSVFYQHSQYKIARDFINNNDWDLNPEDTQYIAQQRVITEQNYTTARDKHRRNRDVYILISSLLYGLNIVDAVVDAHLSEFDLSNDLSLNIKPNVYSINNTFAAGVTLNFKLK